MHNAACHLFTPGDKLFYSAFKDASLQEDAVLTFKTFNPDISAESDYLPFVTTAGVFLLKADDITQLYFYDHTFCLEALVSG
jgi:hypothetical protein